MDNEITLQEFFHKRFTDLNAIEWLEIIEKRNGATEVIEKLSTEFNLELVAERGEVKTREYRIWEEIGNYFRVTGRWHDAIAVYTSLYKHFLEYQISTNTRIHKGMPLCWLADCYYALGYHTLSKRFLMLTLIEDVISMGDEIDPDRTGSYFRLAWKHGLSNGEIQRYSQESASIAQKFPQESMFPEWVLQELDQDWNVEIPIPNEASFFTTNTLYVSFLVQRLGDSQGKTLERLAEYLLTCMPGCKTSRRLRSHSTDYDVVCSLQGPDIDFRSELGRYFVVECKDRKNSVGFGTFAKFCRVLDSVKTRFGILFAKNGISGTSKTINADREQLKVFQDRGMVIIVVDENDLHNIANGGNFIALLRKKYEEVRLDLNPTD